ncbi:PAS domain S-box protein [Maribacter sp. Asnod1-A12]|uniref:PAS domain S-box protein n=1 Tax=Maribacter sp. Asnod1-A12 TaxID=3160576 RepID=UPI00386E8FCF
MRPIVNIYKNELLNTERKTEIVSWLQELTTATILLDNNYNIVDSSEEWKRKFFFDKDKIHGKSIFGIFPSFSKDIKTKLDFAYSGLRGIQMKDEVQLNDGSTKKIIWHFSSWKDHEGNTVGVMLTAEDITILKSLEYDLLKTKNLLNEKGKIAQIGSWEYDVEKEKLTLSDITKKIFKIEEDSKISIDNLINFLDEKENFEPIKKTLSDAIENGTPWERSLKISLNNNEVYVKTIGKPKFKSGKCNRIIGTAQIISNEVATEENEDQLDKDLFFNEAPNAMAVVDIFNGHILKVNRELLKLSGVDKIELEQKNCIEFFENNFSRARFIKIANHSVKDVKGNLDFKDKNGNKRVLSVKGSLIKNGTQLLCVIEDVTASCQTFNELNGKFKKGEKEIDKLLNFTRVIFHNLKGHAINYELMFDFLENVKNKEELKETLAVLRYSTKSLSENILDLKEMVTIGNGAKTKKSRLVVNDYIFKAENNLIGEIKLSKAKIINENPDVLKIKSYPSFLENILTNCISNAIKYRKAYKTPLITISNSITKNHTIILITDNGIGMDLKARGDKLFQMASSLGNDSEARGMGLFLVKHQMDLMKGEIEVLSEPNEGTTIKLLFPHS